MRKLSKLKFIIFCFSVFLFFCFSVSTRADELEDQIEELKDKISQSQAQQKTLSSAISYLDNTIKLTAISIAQSEKKLEALEEEIAKLSLKIGRLDESLETVSQVLLLRIVETYKKATINPLYLFLSADGFSQFLSRYQYLKIIQAHDRQLLYQMEQARFDYDTQKTLKEEKQEEIEAIKITLERQKSALAQQKKDKENLLEITKNDEKRYQELLAIAQAEQMAMLSVMSQVLKDGTPIGQGDKIALMGNTGYPCCSTGLHLHFEIRKDGGPQNPANYLKNRSVIWDNSPDGEFSFSGSWDWPINDPRITQGYGMTAFARSGFYGGDPHTGIDMVDKNHVIKTPKEGTLYKGSTTCGKGCPINYIAIDHGDDLISWYWHVQ